MGSGRRKHPPRSAPLQPGGKEGGCAHSTEGRRRGVSPHQAGGLSRRVRLPEDGVAQDTAVLHASAETGEQKPEAAR